MNLFRAIMSFKLIPSKLTSVYLLSAATAGPAAAAAASIIYL